jgi:hypothetical protein
MITKPHGGAAYGLGKASQEHAYSGRGRIHERHARHDAWSTRANACLAQRWSDLPNLLGRVLAG